MTYHLDPSETGRTVPVRSGLAVLAAVLALALPSTGLGAVMTYMGLGDLVEESDVIVRGEVQQQRTFLDRERGAVFTHTTIDVSRTYLGDESTSVTIEQWGGTRGERTHRIPGDATFEDGEEVVVFLAKNRNDSGGPMYLTGLAQSKFEVIRGTRASGDSAIVKRDLSEIAVVEHSDGERQAIESGSETWTLGSFEATLQSLTYAHSPSQTEGSNE